MEDLRIYYPIYDTKTKVEKSFVNPFEEFIYVAIEKYYKDFENELSYTIKDFYNLSYEEIIELFKRHLDADVIKAKTDEKTQKHTFSVSYKGKFLGYIEVEMSEYVVGERGDNHSIRLFYKDNHMFDYLVNAYEKSAFYLFNDIPNSFHGVRILFSMMKLFTCFGEYGKFRTLNSIKPNSILPLLKKKLNIDPDDDSQFLSVHFGVSDAIAVYAPQKGKMDKDFASIKTKKISYKSYASDIDAFVKEIKNEN